MSAEEELARLERQVLGRPRVASFLDTIAELRRMLATGAPGIREKVLTLAVPQVAADLAAAIGKAYTIGVVDAEKIVGEGVTPGVPDGPPRPIVVAATTAERNVAAEIRKARLLARTGADPAAVLAPVFAARSALERDVTTLVNHAGNIGSTAVADRVGVATVWVAETNACVECLRYSGVTAAPGKPFPGGLTYGKSKSSDPVAQPPRHPRCRCTVEPLVSREYADTLRREADRSVLRGFSLESEPMSVRVDAAARLLERGVSAPKSVKAYAQKAVRAGEFATRGRP